MAASDTAAVSCSWNGSQFLAIRLFHVGNFFIHSDKLPLTKYQFSAVLHRCLKYDGLHCFKFTTHSFRIGPTTEAARMGLDEAVIKRLVRWASGRFNLYVRPNLSV